MPPDLHAVKPRTVDGAVLLADVEAFLRRFVAFPSEAAAVAVTLWAAHAHAVGSFESSPRLALLSPEPGSGKTRTLEVLDLLVPNPLHVLNASAAVIFRAVDAEQPTLLLDEVDTIFGHRTKDENQDLRGLLNAGHRRGAQVPRCVGPNHEMRRFEVYAATALAGLGDLPDTLMSRSIIIRMRRRAPTEHVQPFRHRQHAPEGVELAERLAEWTAPIADELADAWPTMPAGVEDRPADVWEPLLAMADAAGGTWPGRARTACVELVQVAASGEASLGVRLLGDIRSVVDTEGTDRMSTERLLDRLHKLDESPWGDLRGKPLDARGLAYRLRRYDVRPHQFRYGEEKVRGYSIPGGDTDGGGLHDAFSRYLAASHPEGSGTAGTGGTSQVSGPIRVPGGTARTGTAARAGTAREPLTSGVPGVPQVPVYAGSAACAVCALPLNPVLAAEGETTHASCDLWPDQEAR